MSAPLLLFVWSLVSALAILFLPAAGRHPRRYAAAASAIAALAVLTMPVESPLAILGFPVKVPAAWVILGRALVLDPTNRLALAILYLGGAALFEAAAVTFAGRGRVTAGWALLASLAAALLIRPFLFAAVFFELAALAGAVVLSSSDSRRQEPSMRLLTVMTPAMLTVLLAGWFVDTAGVTSATPSLARAATGLLLFGFSILLGVPPFHLWLPAAATERRGEGAAFVLLAMQTTGLMMALRFLDTYDWLRGSPDLYRTIRLAGLILTGAGAATSMAQADEAKSTVYSLLGDTGPVLVALGLADGTGAPLAVALAALRIPGYALAALGARSDEAAGHPGLAAYGRLGLAGFPLTPTFALRLVLLGRLITADATAFWVLAMSSLALTWAALRSSRLRPLRGIGGGSGPAWTRLPALVMAACLLLGAFPGLWTGVLPAASAAWVNLSP